MAGEGALALDGAKLRLAMEKRFLTGAEVARRCNVSASTINRAFEGGSRISTIRKILAALGMDYAEATRAGVLVRLQGEA